MKIRQGLFFVALGAAGALAVAGLAKRLAPVAGDGAEPCPPKGVKRVLFIGADGLSASVVRNGLEAPNLRALMARGAWTLSARSILPSSSACNWASIFQSSGPELNGYIDWNTRTPAVPPAAIGANGRFPDIFSCFRAARPDAEIGYAYEWIGMPYVVDTNACSFARIGGCCDSAVFDYVRTAKPDLMVVVFGDPDGTGHKFGWESKEYREAAARFDGFLGQWLDVYKDAGLLDETVVVVTSDHGGKGKRHGGATLAEMERPLVFVGPGIRRNHEIQTVNATYDVGATIARLLGFRPPRVWTGRFIDEIME
jgi:predicted AlkP superfamily pyrophosphatase or phosphodiesterase